MQKSIFVARALSRKGYRVVMVEEKGWGELCAGRFSRSVDQFHLVPAGGGSRYIEAVVELILQEKVDLFVPCSGAGTTIEDAKVADLVREASKGRVKAIIQGQFLVETLHDKVSTSLSLCRCGLIAFLICRIVSYN